MNTEMVTIGDDGMFATLVYCLYDLETRSLVFTNAGHCVPLLRRGDRVFPLHADRAHIAPIGVVPDLEAGEARVQLMSGDMLLLVSDGILEACDAWGFEYGVGRLSRRLRTARGSCEDVIKAILQDVDSHAAHGQQATIRPWSRCPSTTAVGPAQGVDPPGVPLEEAHSRLDRTCRRSRPRAGPGRASRGSR
ncbi:MAG: PP2C family protein-serine/threonine phosphatase [Kofleriaceae bacterium]